MARQIGQQDKCLFFLLDKSSLPCYTINITTKHWRLQWQPNDKRKKIRRNKINLGKSATGWLSTLIIEKAVRILIARKNVTKKRVVVGTRSNNVTPPNKTVSKSRRLDKSPRGYHLRPLWNKQSDGNNNQRWSPNRKGSVVQSQTKQAPWKLGSL